MSFHSTHDMERKTLCCSLKTHFIDPTTKQREERKKKVQLETEKQAKAHEDAGVGRTLKKSAMHFKR